ncbi:lipopolysaccharide assembly protein LapA domain-containing protein [Elusimicrobiota bacterium]
MLKIYLSIILFFVVLLGLFAIFNQAPCGVVLLGAHLQASSLAMVAFFSFLAGALCVAIIGVIGNIRLRRVISKQKRELKELCKPKEQI